MKGLTIQKWGNSQGIRIPKEILNECGLRIGDRLECNIEREKIVLRLVAGTRRKKYDLADLLANVPKNFENHEYDFGKPAGKED